MEVEAAIKRLRIGKAPGSDGLSAEFYRHFLNKLIDVLTQVFNAIFDSQELSPS